MYKEPKYKPVAERALLMEFSDAIEPICNEEIRKILAKPDLKNVKGLIEILPTYRSILFYYDPIITDYYEFKKALDLIYKEKSESLISPYRIVEIPVFYGGEMGPDLEFVAEHNGLKKEEVIEIHTEAEYLVYMLGFTPGFTYLGGLDKRIFTPRLKTARLKIAKGSVGIADKQTGIYPIESPGGWQLIGRTPISLYNPEFDPPVLLKAGDHIKFKSVSMDEYLSLEGEVEKGQIPVRIIDGGSHE